MSGFVAIDPDGNMRDAKGNIVDDDGGVLDSPQPEPESYSVVDDIKNTANAFIGGVNEAPLSALNTLEKAVTDDGSWTDRMLHDAKAMKGDSAVGMAGEIAGDIAGAFTGAKALEATAGVNKLFKHSDSLRNVVGGDFLSELLQTGDPVEAGISAGLTGLTGGGADAVNAYAKADDAVGYLSQEAKDLVNDGVPLTSRTMQNKMLPMEDTIDADKMLRGSRQLSMSKGLAAIAETLRVNAVSKPLRRKISNYEKVSDVRDTNVIKMFNEDIFLSAVPPKLRASWDGISDSARKSAGKLETVVNGGYDSVFKNVDISKEFGAELGKEAKRLKTLYFKQIKKGGKKAFISGDNVGVAKETIALLGSASRGRVGSLRQAYQNVKKLRMDADADMKPMLDNILDAIKDEVPDKEMLKEMDAYYPKFLALDDASKSGVSKSLGWVEFDDVAKAAGGRDNIPSHDVFGDELKKWSPIANARAGMTPRSLEQAKKDFSSDILRREDKFKTFTEGGFDETTAFGRAKKRLAEQENIGMKRKAAKAVGVGIDSMLGF